MLLVAAFLALLLAFLGAYLVVISQNPKSTVSGPSTNYGSVSP